jgi:exodeoxyribonuclease VII large subunit
MRNALQRCRATLHTLERRRGLATWEARLAMRGRHLAELSHQLRTAISVLVARRIRHHRALDVRLQAHDMRRRLASVRARLEAGDARLAAAAVRSHDRARARLATLSARLDSLSPLAVLARGYAVCWSAERTEIIRQADIVSPGDRVRVTLQEGELDCEVKGRE